MPLTTELPVGDLFEFIGDFRLNGDGPPTTGRMGLDRLQAILLGSTSLVGARIALIEGRLTTAEGFTNQITNINTRLQTVEALGGISNGTDLVADGAAVRTTRYWGRPGEAPRTWTASIAATSSAAAPLVASGAYSIVATTMGPALRITGVASARPIAQIPLDDTQVEEFKAVVKRGIDDTTTPANPANNAPVFVFACFKADGTDNGTVALPADPLTVAQGFKSYTFRASLVAGLGTVDLPANTRRVNLIPGGKGTGAIDVLSVERSSQSLTSAPDMADAIAPEDRIFIFDDSVKLIKKYSFAQLEAYLAPPPVYWFKGPKTASKAEGTLIAAPAGAAIIQNFRIQNTSRTAYIAVAFRGVVASLTDGGSYIFGPGQGRDFDVLPQGRIGIISDTDGSSISCDFTSTINLDPNAADRAAKHLARYGTAMTAPQTSAVGTLYNALYDAGWIDLCAKGGYLWVGSAPSNFDGLINWSGTNTFSRILLGDNTIQPDTSFSGTLFNGSNAIDSLVKPTVAALPNHALFAWTDATLKNFAKVSAGNTVIRLNPDRSSGADSVYTGAGSSILTGIPGYGGLKGYVRRDADNFRYYRNGDYRQDVAKTVNETTGGSQTLAIGALNTGSGIQQGETTPMKMSLYTPTIPTDDQVTKLYNAFAAFHTALGA
ncbi:hypothetical protein [Methylobacterium sp. 77]|uniref:hypothetical protein n=1 Tax=Methylobacterium sp. 77 TaxID=1101192 RepID=UPI00036F06DD|nr:hypothetical protein [Methylobacterium sp. 77]